MSIWLALAPWRRRQPRPRAPVVDATAEAPTRPISPARIQMPELDVVVFDDDEIPTVIDTDFGAGDDWIDAVTELAPDARPPKPATVLAPLDWDVYEVAMTMPYDDYRDDGDIEATLIEVDIGPVRGR